VPFLTVLCVQSGFHPGSYARREDREQLELLGRMAQPGFREEILAEAAVWSSGDLLRPRSLAENLERAVGDVARRRGGLIDELRRVRGPALEVSAPCVTRFSPGGR